MNWEPQFRGWLLSLQPGDDIRHKPVPNWPNRRSYRTQVREARRNRRRARA